MSIAIPTLQATILSREFRPTDIAGCKLWLRADRGLWQDAARTVPVTADGDPIGAWEDLSGNGNHATQSTAAAKPVWKVNIVNGRPVVRFDGVDDILDSVFTASEPLTMFGVHQSGDYGTARTILAGASGTSNHSVWYAVTTGRITITVGTGVTALSESSASGTGWLISATQFNAASSGLWVNGGSRASGSLSSQSLTKVRVGAWFDGSSPFLGDITQVIVYNRALSTSERQRVERHLGNYYAITVSS